MIFILCTTGTEAMSNLSQGKTELPDVEKA